jgi:hypothetical protein
MGLLVFIYIGGCLAIALFLNARLDEQEARRLNYGREHQGEVKTSE